MPRIPRLPHLKLNGFFDPRTYKYPKKIQVDFPVVQRDRGIHGREIRRQLEEIRQRFRVLDEESLPQNIVRDDAIYVEFISEFNFPLKFESLTQEKDEPQYQILTIKEEKVLDDDNAEKSRFRVVVMMKEGGVSKFIKKATDYISENTKRAGIFTDKPKNNDLIANIANIQFASLQAFWSDGPEIPFPALDDVLWWEVWFRRTNSDSYRLERVYQNLAEVGATISQQTLIFPEHIVKLVRGSARQLSTSLYLLDNLAELRKPQEISDFITGRNVDFPDKIAWMNDLRQRTDVELANGCVMICLLDSGVHVQHPLLASIIPNERLFTFKADWGTSDSWDSGGHGTPMAGLALYGDLVDALSTSNRIQILHGVESFKIIHPADPNDPNFYGYLTEYACSTPIATFPENKRVYCLSVTDSETAYYGRPSSWSSSIDRIAYGEIFEPRYPQLFIISSGNVDYITSGASAQDFPVKNELESIHDPGQAYNAITVGSYTRMDRIDQQIWNGVSCLAPNGGISPSNSTSLTWDSQWPNKPDIVMEGGNLGVSAIGIRDDIHSLKPLSLDKDFTRFMFMPFGDTSGAAALASKMAAELIRQYPSFWPESIRGLLIHSAEWTSTMLGELNFQIATNALKRNLLRKFGYGVPVLENALYSASNSLTLLCENTIQPYRLENSSVKYNEYHLYTLPWPTEILQNELGSENVTLKVTLSYFIDPNPGNRRYANNFHYHSHSLDFKVIKPTEDLAVFQRRISAAVEGAEESSYEGGEEPWSIKESLRNKGSIKKDFIATSGADLAVRNIIAIYPKSGWYKTRKKLNKYNSIVRYSLIITVETESTEVNIYNAVENTLNIPVTVPIT